MSRPGLGTADIAVIGAGSAGLYAALCAAREGARVTLVSAAPLAESASYWAQGGVAAALGEGDDPAEHLADTVAAGRGAVRQAAAEVLCREAPDRVRDLQALGVSFDLDAAGHLSLGLEGGHGARRVAHAGGSATGRRIVRQLSAVVAEERRITIVEGQRATALLLADDDGRCAGMVGQSGVRIAARAVLLSTGGAAALWSRTTNPPGATGSGLLLAQAAGAALADLELVQFHPTAVIGLPGREGFLITEAIRGEGGVLIDADGERFVDELAPRDEVARAIQARLSQGTGPVLLDMREVDAGRFPNVVEALRSAGLDPTTTPIPVAPAAHYTMGGIVTDLDGATAVPGLHAVGECSCTGLHGANRLASNSLSECLVFGRRAALAALGTPAAAAAAVTAVETAGTALPTPETRRAMWRCAGPVRTADGLRALQDDPHPLARITASAALARAETRGAHRRADHPELDPRLDLHHGVIDRAGAAPTLQLWA